MRAVISNCQWYKYTNLSNTKIDEVCYENKRIVRLIILILISIITLIGSSYALLTKSFKSEKLSMQVGTLKVDFTESNSINLNNTISMSDNMLLSDGKKVI